LSNYLPTFYCNFLNVLILDILILCIPDEQTQFSIAVGANHAAHPTHSYIHHALTLVMRKLFQDNAKTSENYI